jgi:hypothetical protein
MPTEDRKGDLENALLTHGSYQPVVSGSLLQKVFLKFREIQDPLLSGANRPPHCSLSKGVAWVKMEQSHA